MNENPTNVDEQANLGLCYLNGNGVPQDMKKAVYWITKAAEQGHVEAQLSPRNACASTRPCRSTSIPWR